GDPAPVLRRRRASGDRLARDRAGDGQSEAEGRACEVLRRRHQPQTQAAREAEGGQAADEAGRGGRGAAGGLPRRAQPQRWDEEMNGVPSTAPSTSVVQQSRPGLLAAPAEPPRPRGGIASDAVRHLYVHLPFCAHRCGYCDFVTVVGRRGQHAAYVDGLLAEFELERELLAGELETVFLGGGTPTFTEPRELERLLAALPGAAEVTVEANPETVTPALALRPDHLSCYELEAKPGTRFTHAHGEELRRQAEAMEGYFECVVETLVAAGYRWYETANFCRAPEADAGARDLRSRHNLAYWRGRDYLGLGIGAVSTVRGQRWRTTPRLGTYLAALREGRRPLRER